VKEQLGERGPGGIERRSLFKKGAREKSASAEHQVKKRKAWLGDTITGKRTERGNWKKFRPSWDGSGGKGEGGPTTRVMSPQKRSDASSTTTGTIVQGRPRTKAPKLGGSCKPKKKKILKCGGTPGTGTTVYLEELDERSCPPQKKARWGPQEKDYF